MQTYQEEFIHFIIKHEILCFGRFTLKSGRVSPYFFNAGLFNSGEALSFLGRSYAAAIQQANLKYDLLFGPAYKGIPLVSVTASALAEHHQVNKHYCFNRKEAKAHGEGGQTVGAPLAGNVLIIDDVITAGTAIGEVMALLQEAKARPAGIVVALDRQEKGKNELSAIQEIEQTHQVPVISIVNLEQIIGYLRDNPKLRRHAAQVEDYREQYGV